MSSNFCGNSDITKIFVVEPVDDVIYLTAVTITVFSGGTIDGNLTVNGNIINCGSGSTLNVDNIISCHSGVTINNAFTVYPTQILPTSDGIISLGSQSNRFSNIRTLSGTSNVWTAINTVNTTTVNLGQNVSGETRQITANNCVLQDDILYGGTY